MTESSIPRTKPINTLISTKYQNSLRRARPVKSVYFRRTSKYQCMSFPRVGEAQGSALTWGANRLIRKNGEESASLAGKRNTGGFAQLAATRLAARSFPHAPFRRPLPRGGRVKEGESLEQK